MIGLRCPKTLSDAGKAQQRLFDLLGPHLGAADVDDAVGATKEMRAVAIDADHVAGTPPAERIRQPPHRRTEIPKHRNRAGDFEHSIGDPQTHRVDTLVDPTRREARPPILHRHERADLARTVDVPDLGARQQRMQPIENVLVDGLAREPNAREGEPRSVTIFEWSGSSASRRPRRLSSPEII